MFVIIYRCFGTDRLSWNVRKQLRT